MNIVQALSLNDWSLRPLYCVSAFWPMQFPTQHMLRVFYPVVGGRSRKLTCYLYVVQALMHLWSLASVHLLVFLSWCLSTGITWDVPRQEASNLAEGSLFFIRVLPCEFSFAKDEAGCARVAPKLCETLCNWEGWGTRFQYLGRELSIQETRLNGERSRHFICNLPAVQPINYKRSVERLAIADISCLFSTDEWLCDNTIFSV